MVIRSNTTTKVPALPEGTYYLSISGTGFETTSSVTTYNHTTNHTGGIFVATADALAFADVILVNGAIVTGVITYATGNIGTGSTHKLFRKLLSDGTTSEMSSAAFNVEDTTITNATIDNSLYSYFIQTTPASGFDYTISGARITYII